MRLQGKSALVTGAARGIGAAFARAYVAEGATVAIGDIDLARAEATAADIGPGAYAVRLDVTDQASIDAGVAAVVARAGGLDILINNAAALRRRADRRDHPRELRPALPHQRRRHALHPPGRRPPDDRAGPRRQDHQHGVAGRAPRRGARRRLLRDQGRDHQPHPVGRPRPRSSTASTSTPSPPASSTASTGTASTRSSPSTRTAPSARRSASSARACPIGRMGDRRRPRPAWRSSSPAQEADYIVAQTYNVDGGQWMS